MPAAFLSDNEAWDQYIGSVWHGLIRAVAPDPDCAIIEIAPGSSAKIGYGLASYGFKGSLYIVDCAPDALARLEIKYKRLLPQADIRFICATLKESLPSLPRNAGMFLANHILDDMLLGEADEVFKREKIFKWSSAYTPTVSQGVQEAWNYLMESPERMMAKKREVANGITHALSSLDPAISIFSQYPSSTLQDAGREDINNASLDILDLIAGQETKKWRQEKIQDILSANKNYNNAHIGTNILNARHWLVSAP